MEYWQPRNIYPVFNSKTAKQQGVLFQYPQLISSICHLLASHYHLIYDDKFARKNKKSRLTSPECQITIIQAEIMLYYLFFVEDIVAQMKLLSFQYTSQLGVKPNKNWIEMHFDLMRVVKHFKDIVSEEKCYQRLKTQHETLHAMKTSEFRKHVF